MFLVRKTTGHDRGTLYAMKVLKKQSVVRKKKIMEHTLTERSVLEAIRNFPFLVTLHYAFQTETKLHLVMGMRGREGRAISNRRGHYVCVFVSLVDYVCGGELFTHLHQLGPFAESSAKIYAAEITLALEHLHSVSRR